MSVMDEKDPVEIAADVAELISVRYGIPQNKVIMMFMRSRTFTRVLEDKEFASGSPEEIIDAYNTEVGGIEEEGFSNKDYVVMKMDITLHFAKKFGMSIKDTVSLFYYNRIYEYLDHGGEVFITRTYPYMVSHIAKELHMEDRPDSN